MGMQTDKYGIELQSHHDMESFSALLSFYEWNLPVTDGLPPPTQTHKWPVMQSFMSSLMPVRTSCLM